ncbi:MAG: TolC family protein [Bacteroidetes bacterium]|nr:TolC family protein [Bacteroidota bacterium]
MLFITEIIPVPKRSGIIKHGFIQTIFPFFLCAFFSLHCTAQNKPAADSTSMLTLGQCIEFALQHQPALNQSYVNVDITRATNAINLSGWLPQVNVAANLTHYNTLPTAFIKNSSGTVVEQKTGVINTSTPVLSITQTIFNPSLFYAFKSAKLYVQQAEQITDSTKINIVATVSKAFYNLLLTLQQIDVLKEDTTRLSKNLHDTYHQYVSGIVDETDYDQAAITLNNSVAQLKQANENVVPQYALLKQIMGMPAGQQFNVVVDTLQMQRDIAFDTTQQLQYQKRIEFQQLQTAKKIQGQFISYYKNAWIPTLGAFFDYDYPFQNNSFGSLFSNAYPYSYLGISLNVPIFTGFARTQNLKKARLQQKLLEWDEVNLQSQIYSEYTSALANYRSNYYNLDVMKKNTDLAKKVYDIVTLQYSQGVVAYLNVITAESNLISSEIGYLNALFQLLSSKIDLEKSMGIITVNH